MGSIGKPLIGLTTGEGERGVAMYIIFAARGFYIIVESTGRCRGFVKPKVKDQN